MPTPDQLADINEETRHAWELYAAHGVDPKHVAWLREHGITHPDQWFEAPGDAIRREFGMRMPTLAKKSWVRFREQYPGNSLPPVPSGKAARRPGMGGSSHV